VITLIISTTPGTLCKKKKKKITASSTLAGVFHTRSMQYFEANARKRRVFEQRETKLMRKTCTERLSTK